ncbi:MAG: TIR domain-containing protein [Anaerolineae bacterium]|nr:TIR domain-containing protein [Anaerolineae bacterium]
MAFVYIAYAHKDGTRLAQRINDGLKSAGFQSWFDRERLDPGAEWQKTIDGAIRDALAVVFIITPESVRSEFILKVYLEAFKRYNKQIFPVLGGDVQESDMPDLIRNYQWIDFRRDFEKSLSRLVAVLHRLDDESRLEEKGSVYVDVQPGDSAEEQPVIETVLENTESAYIPSEFVGGSQTVSAAPATAEGTATEGAPEPIPPEPVKGTASVTLDPVTAKAAGTITPPLKSRVDKETLIHVLTDAPTTADVLGFRDYAIVLAEFIRNQKSKNDHEQPKREKVTATPDTISPKPLVIAIDAPWGTGKTSLMYMLQEELESGKGDFIPVWFNAWKYDQEESLWAALALTILREVRNRLRRRARFRLWLSSLDREKVIRSATRGLVYAVMVFAVGLVALWLFSEWSVNGLQPGKDDNLPLIGILGTLAQLFSAAGGLSISILGVIIAGVVGAQIYNRYLKFDLNITQYIKQPDYGERVGFLGEFDNDFRRIVRTVTQSGKNPLVIFIDDLDRCEPPKSVEIIEAINVLIDSQYCVYIIGMDSRGVAASIENKYADLKGFYESDSDPGGLTLGQQFLEKIIQINFRIPPITETAIAGFIDQNLHTTPGAPSVDSPELRQTLERSIDGLDYNPRRVKRLLTELLNRPRNIFSSSDDDSQPGTPEQVPSVKTVALSDHVPDEELEQRRQRAREFQGMRFEDMESVQQATLYAAEVMDYNPRKIKRFLNEFRLRAAIADQRNLLILGEIDLSKLGCWITIGTRWPDMIGILTERPAFAAELLDAHTLREEWRALRTQTPAADADTLKQKSAELSRFLTQPDIKRFIDAADLIRLLDEMGDAARDEAQIIRYLHLPYTMPAAEQQADDSVPG